MKNWNNNLINGIQNLRLIECCICCDYLTDVRETPCCHYLFCHSCIRSWLQTSTKTCPRCRSTTLTEQTLTKNYVIERFVDNLEFDCPHNLQGCPAKVPRCDLTKHKRLCQYSPEKLDYKNRQRLEELQTLLIKYKTEKRKVTDHELYDLAQSFYTEHQYQSARECLQLIKNKENLPEMIILQAKIEQDDSHFDQALEFYTQADSRISSDSKRSALFLSQGHIYIKIARYGQAKDVLKQALMNYDGTLIVVSHDRDFLEGLTSVTYEFANKGIKEHLGDISEFLEIITNTQIKLNNIQRYHNW